MKRFHCIPLSLLAALCLAAAARADIVTLKSGEKYEGRIHDDTGDSIQIEYHLTPKIKDNKTILKSDIKEIKRQTASEVEFQERGIAGILPTPNLLSASDYEAIIQDKLRTFVAKYPGTPESAQVEKIIATLAEEKSKVSSGQLKVEGKWMDSANVKREAYDVEAYRQKLLMKSSEAEVNDMHYLNALRAFEKLRSDYGASPYFAMEIPDALDLLKKYEAQLNTMVAEAPILKKKRDDGLKSTNPSEVAEARRLIDAEMKTYQATVDQQTKAKVKWKDINKFDVKGLQDALATVTKERAELQALDLTALAQENQMLMSIIRYLADGNAMEARSVYDQLSKQQNLVNKSMLPGLAKQIEAAQKDAANATKKAKAAVITEPPATSPKDDHATVNPVAETLKKIQAEKDKKAADAKNGVVTPGDKKPGAAAGPTPAKPTTPATAAAAAAAPAEESGGLSDYIPYVGGGLLLVLLIAWFIGKKKKEKE